MVIHFMNTFRVQNKFYILPLYFVTIRIWEPKPRINKVLTFTFKIYQISVNYLDITIYTGLRFSNCHKLDTKSLIIPLNNFQILSQKKRIYSHIRHSKNTNDLSTLKIIFNDFKGHLSKRKNRYSEKEINSIITKFQEKKENSYWLKQKYYQMANINMSWLHNSTIASKDLKKYTEV